MLYRVEALVVRSTDYGEGNKILTLFTEAYGKIGVMARGAKKMKSRHSAVAQLFTYGEFVFYRIGQQLGSLNHADILVSHHKLREHLLLSAYASYLTEMTDRVTMDHEPQPFLFRQLKAAFEQLEDGKDAHIIIHIYEMKILSSAGYAPTLDRCVECSAQTDHPVLSNRLGGILCERCELRDSEAVYVGDTILKLLRIFAAVDLNRLGKIDVKPEIKSALKKWMRSWLDTYMNTVWRSRHVMDQLDEIEM